VRHRPPTPAENGAPPRHCGEDFTNEEIAVKIGHERRTVERRLALVCKPLEKKVMP
jgi:hypothetical protein